MYTYQPRGVCSREIHIDLDGDTCGRRSTSCADQLVQGLRAARAAE